MARSPISLLQEYCIVEYKTYPEYITNDVSLSNVPRFSCECIVKNTRTSGIASSKSVAKQMASTEMVIKLGIAKQGLTIAPQTPRIASTVAVANDNYIGYLNEYSSKNNMTYPVYTELPSQGSSFVIQCKHQNLTTIGKGTNKKIAKKESAKAMVNYVIPNGHTSLPERDKVPDNNNSLIHLSNELSLLSLDKPCKNENKCETSYDIGMDAFFEEGNFVGALNEYCDKHKYRKPEYFDIGKKGTLFSTRCLYQAFRTIGKGLTIKFAKQSSAMQMLEVIGVKTPNNNYERVHDSPIKTVIPTPTITQAELNAFSKQITITNEDVAEEFKKLTVLRQNTSPAVAVTTVEDLIHFDEEPSSTSNFDINGWHEKLHDDLKKMGVVYKISISQKADPCILVLNGRKPNGDGNYLEKTLMDLGDSPREALKDLLLQALESFK